MGGKKQLLKLNTIKNIIILIVFSSVVLAFSQELAQWLGGWAVGWWTWIRNEALIQEAVCSIPTVGSGKVFYRERKLQQISPSEPINSPHIFHWLDTWYMSLQLKRLGNHSLCLDLKEVGLYGDTYYSAQLKVVRTDWVLSTGVL